MPRVRTTMRPDQPIEVDDVEAADLRALGLLVDEPAPVAPAASAPPANPAKKSSGAAGSKES